QHFSELEKNKSFSSHDAFAQRHIIGEVIMNKDVFTKKYSEDYRNPRNLVAGLFNQKDPSQALQDVDFIAYGLGDDISNKEDSLNLLAKFNTVSLPWKKCILKDIDDELLTQLYQQWGMNFEIDGLIIELNDFNRRTQLGREKNNNPCYSRAWKGYGESSEITTVEDITYQISKEGRLTLVGNVAPINLDGVTVSNVTLYNASTAIAEKWGIGSKIEVIRSGMVIPKIIRTLEGVTPELPTHCPSCSEVLEWDDNEVNLICSNLVSCPAQRHQRIIAFFKIMGVDEVGPKILEQFYDNGYDTVEKILKLEAQTIEGFDRFAERKAQLVIENIHQKMKNVPLEKVQHASGLFKRLGSKKLALVNQFDRPDKKPSFEDLIDVDGFSEVSAKAYLKAFDEFWVFLAALPITLAERKELSGEGACQGMSICFTGFRDNDLKEQVENAGGRMVSGVSGKTTHVIAKDPESTSSKIKKARDLGLIIMTPEQLFDVIQN
ncbi:MAG: hypothetical protein HQL32_07750, partial [Planctomycetes bacterium]|nr:hypothetical protein [Planctomycetota bacterium]